MTDFDTPIDRLNTGSNKWSKYPADVLPMWVADMDFAVAPPIVAALQQRFTELHLQLRQDTPTIAAHAIDQVLRS